MRLRSQHFLLAHRKIILPSNAKDRMSWKLWYRGEFDNGGCKQKREKNRSQPSRPSSVVYQFAEEKLFSFRHIIVVQTEYSGKLKKKKTLSGAVVLFIFFPGAKWFWLFYFFITIKIHAYIKCCVDVWKK